MDVLVLDTHGRSGQLAQRQLEESGHRVLRCHEQDSTDFACVALDDPAACPLNGDAVDVALVVRDQPSSGAIAPEDGAACALRRFVPLVIADETGSHPFHDRATATISGTAGVVDACVQAATARLTRHEPVALAMLRTTLASQDVSTDDCDVIVRRSGDVTRIELRAAGLDTRLRSMVATRVGAAIRAMDHTTPRLSIAVVDVATGKSTAVATPSSADT